MHPVGYLLVFDLDHLYFVNLRLTDTDYEWKTHETARVIKLLRLVSDTHFVFSNFSPASSLTAPYIPAISPFAPTASFTPARWLSAT